MSTDVHTLSGAYAINALDPEEAREFECHLAECLVCAAEVAELQHAAAMMAEAETERPPEALRARVLTAADRERQLPPLTRSLDEKRAAGDEGRRGRWTRRLLSAAAAVVLVVGAGIGYSQIVDHDQDVPTASAAGQVFQAPDAQTATLDTSGGGQVEVATSQSLHEMALDTSELPQLDGSRVYQLWVVRGTVPTSAGVVGNPDAGASMALPEKGAQVAITIEPEGGSDKPTGKQVVTLDPRDV